MSKKFFSLIHGDKVHIAPGTKIIPQETFSTLLAAEEVLHEVKKDAEKYRDEVKAEGEQLKEREKQRGFEQGYHEWVEKIADLEEEIQKVRKDTEKVIIPIALKAAKKIVGRELEISQSTVVDIIKNSLRAVASHKKIKLYVNRKEFEAVEKKKEELKSLFENLESLVILPQDDIAPAGCIIETEGGIINAQLENQWIVMENAFQKLLSSKKLPPSEAVVGRAQQQVQEAPVTPVEPVHEEKEPEEAETLEEEEEEEEESEGEWEDEDEWDEEEWEEEETDEHK